MRRIIGESAEWSARTASGAICARRGLVPYDSPSRPHDHVLRNHKVGKTRRAAACGPRFAIAMRIRMSSGLPFAYSTVTSK